MKSAFISGATGFLGRHMVDVLIENDWQVTALCRDTAKAEPLAERGVEVRQGSVENAGDLLDAMPDCPDAVFHMAANTSTWRAHRQMQLAANVDGTKNMLMAAAQKGAGRFIYTSSTAVYGHHKGAKNEKNDQLGGSSKVGYVKSKWLAERLVRSAAGEGLASMILNPGHIIGAYDTHNWARMFYLVNKGSLPGIPPGSGSFANAREVATAHLAAVDKGVPGENYLLGGPHHRFLEVLTIIGKLLDKPVPKRVTPKPLLLALAHSSDLISRLTKREPQITPESCHFLCNDDIMDSSKAEEVLGYKQIPLAKSLEECQAWLVANGLLEL